MFVWSRSLKDSYVVMLHCGAAEYELRAPHMAAGTGRWEGDRAVVTLLPPVSAVGRGMGTVVCIPSRSPPFPVQVSEVPYLKSRGAPPICRRGG